MTPTPTRVLVVRLGALGDLVHTLPAVAAIRRALPSAEIDWLVEPRHRELLTLVPGLSQIIVLDRRSVGGWIDVVRELRSRRYDVAIDFQGLIKSAALARFSGATRVIGFNRAALREPAARWFYTETAHANDGQHVIFKNLALAGVLAGVRVDERSDSLTFPLIAIESSATDDVRRKTNGGFALVNPGAAWPNKRWPVEQFGAVSAYIKDAHGLTPVILWGPNERALAEAVVTASGGAAIVAPETQLKDLVELSRHASLMVSGDTGPLHIAGAVGTPIVSLFGPTDAKRNGPWHPQDVVLSRYDQCACHYKRQCLQPHAWCLPQISVDDVTRAIAKRSCAAK